MFQKCNECLIEIIFFFWDGFVKTLDLKDEKYQVTRALILVPTRELSEQVSAYLRGLLIYCDTDVSISNVASGTTTHLQRSIHSTRIFFFANLLKILKGSSCQTNLTS